MTTQQQKFCCPYEVIEIALTNGIITAKENEAEELTDELQVRKGLKLQYDSEYGFILVDMLNCHHGWPKAFPLSEYMITWRPNIG